MSPVYSSSTELLSSSHPSSARWSLPHLSPLQTKPFNKAASLSSSTGTRLNKNPQDSFLSQNLALRTLRQRLYILFWQAVHPWIWLYHFVAPKMSFIEWKIHIYAEIRGFFCFTVRFKIAFLQMTNSFATFYIWVK